LRFGPPLSKNGGVNGTQEIRTLKDLGWNDHFESLAAEEATPGWLPFRVVGEERGMWRLQGEGTGLVWGEIPGKWRKGADTRLEFPAVGDWVLGEPVRNDSRTLIRKVLTRKSCLVRKAAGTGEEPQVLAANVDIAFLVTSLNYDLNPRRLERYLALVWDGGAVPVILLTKVDLVADPAPLIAEIQAIAVGAQVAVISSKTGQGLDAVRALLSPGQTVVLLGSSGVGKSTLINKLLGREKQRVQEAREGDDKGRHTTTTRFLLPMPGGSLIIDTPGMRELHLWDPEEGIEKLFSEVEELGLNCRFSDCQHEGQPGCAVAAALHSGVLPRERFNSYLKLRKESVADKRKTDKAFASEENKKNRSATKSLRSHVKGKRGGDPSSKK
jgi:ribosome biogenesis GTPase / thiamine phosphate phosphatase